MDIISRLPTFYDKTTLLAPQFLIQLALHSISVWKPVDQNVRIVDFNEVALTEKKRNPTPLHTQCSTKHSTDILYE